MQPALVCFGQVILIPAFQPDGMSSTVSVSKLESEIWGRKGCDTGKDDPPGQVGQKIIPGLARCFRVPELSTVLLCPLPHLSALTHGEFQSELCTGCLNS